MQLTIDLPPQMEQAALSMGDALGKSAKEGLLVEMYRKGIISKLELRDVLGLDRFQVNQVLKHHGVTEDQESADDIRSTVDAIRTARVA